MRIIVYSILGLLLVGSFFVPEVQLEVAKDPQYETARLGALGLVFLNMFVRGFIVRAKEREANELIVTEKALSTDLNRAETELRDTMEKLVKAKEELKRGRAEWQEKAALLEEKAKKTAEDASQFETAARDLQRQLDEAQNTNAKEEDQGGDTALSLLAQLQKEGRLLDFVMDDITNYPDERIGAVARIVHKGCRSVFDHCFAIRPVQEGKAEGEAISVGDDGVSDYRLLGKVGDAPPYHGKLLHKGWKTEKVELPVRAGAAAERLIIAPAEVEVT